MDDYNRCKYCNVKLIVLDNNEICCPSCGLVYEAKYNRNESINYFKALEWN